MSLERRWGMERGKMEKGNEKMYQTNINKGNEFFHSIS